MQNNNQNQNNLPPDILAKAKDMYMEGEKVVNIAKELDISRSSIQYHVSSSWKEERELKEASMLAVMAKASSNQLIKLMDSSLKLVQDAIDGASSRGSHLSLEETKDVVSILKTLAQIAAIGDKNKGGININVNNGEVTKNGSNDNKAPKTIDTDFRVVDPFKGK